MNAPVQDRLFDLMLRTSYNKRAMLDVPIFEDKSLTGSASYSDQAIEIVQLGDGDTDTVLGLVGTIMSDLIASDLRFEPTNDAPFHRSYPSPRGLYPVDFIIALASEHETATFAYECENHALVLETGPFDVLHSSGCTIRIELVTALDRIAPLYGELSPTLCALEAGHALQAIGDILLQQGLEFSISLAGVAEVTGPLDGRVVLAQIDIHGRFAGAPNRVATHLSRKAQRAFDPVSLERISHAHTILSDASGALCHTGFTAGWHADRGQQPRLRTAGAFPNGMSGAFVSGDQIEALVHALHAGLAGMAASNIGGPAVTLAWTTPTDAAFVLAPGAATPHLVERGRDKLAQAFGGSFAIDLETLRLFAFFTAPWRQVASRDGSWGYIQALVKAGQVAQMIGNRAAEAGFFARPFRGMNEEILETGLGLHGQVFYSVLLGKSRAANPAFSVGPIHRSARP